MKKLCIEVVASVVKVFFSFRVFRLIQKVVSVNVVIISLCVEKE